MQSNSGLIGSVETLNSQDGFLTNQAKVVQQGNVFGGTQSFVGAGFSTGYAALRNPSGSGNYVIVDRVFTGSDAAGYGAVVRLTSGTFSNVVKGANYLVNSTDAVGETALISSPGFGDAYAYFNIGNDYPVTVPFPWPLILTPGESILLALIAGSGINYGAATFAWREFTM